MRFFYIGFFRISGDLLHVWARWWNYICLVFHDWFLSVLLPLLPLWPSSYLTFYFLSLTSISIIYYNFTLCWWRTLKEIVHRMLYFLFSFPFSDALFRFSLGSTRLWIMLREEFRSGEAWVCSQDWAEMGTDSWWDCLIEGGCGCFVGTTWRCKEWRRQAA